MHSRKLIALFFVLFSLVFHQSKVEAQSGPALEILQLVNQFRVNNGLPAFQVNQALVSAAQNQANYMAEFTVFSSHTGYGGSSPQTRADAAGYGGFVVENIVGGTGMSAQQGLTWWRNSPVHYNTLVTSRYTQAGTAFATNGTENFFVLVVGRVSTTPPTAGVEDESPAPLFVTPITLSQPKEDGSITHVVQDGQALWSLAAYYDVELNDLLLYNNLSETSYLQPGDEVVIRLADGAPPPPTATPTLTHIVLEGQSLWSIAIRYNVEFANLLLLNGLTEDSLLKPGDEIQLRLAPGQAPPPTPTPVVFHTVTSGQTLWDIALAHGLNLDELLAFNAGLTADSILQPGDQIQVRLPAPTVPPTVPPTAVSTATNTPIPTPTSLSITSTPAQVADLNESALLITPEPATLEQGINGRSTSTLLYTAAIFMAIAGGGLLWWSKTSENE